jgi:hypothetical protein
MDQAVLWCNWLVLITQLRDRTRNSGLSLFPQQVTKTRCPKAWEESRPHGTASLIHVNGSAERDGQLKKVPKHWGWGGSWWPITIVFNEAVSTTNIKIRIVEWRKDVINNVQHERNWQEATVGFQGNYYLRILLDRLRKTQIKLNVLPNQDPNCVEYPGRNCAFCLRHYFAGRRKTKHIH